MPIGPTVLDFKPDKNVLTRMVKSVAGPDHVSVILPVGPFAARQFKRAADGAPRRLSNFKLLPGAFLGGDDITKTYARK